MGIRGKLVLTLGMLGCLPLLAVLLFSVQQWTSWRQKVAQEAISSLATAEARVMAVGLARDIQSIRFAANTRQIISTLCGPIREMPRAQREQLDKAWPATSDSAGPLKDVLGHPISKALREFIRKDPRILQMFITDRLGQLIATTSRTDDFYQADEDWWIDTFNDGLGRVHIPPVSFDRPTADFIFSICMPIYSGENIIGIAKAKVSANQWIRASSGNLGGVAVLPMLVNDDGLIIYRHGLEPMTRQIGLFGGDITVGASGSRTTDTEIQGFAPIILQERISDMSTQMPKWSLVMYADKAAVLGQGRRLAIFMLVGGLAVIAAIFFSGVLLMDRTIVRRLRSLQNAAHQVAGGDLTLRVSEPGVGRFFAGDEVESLTRDFNDMIARVQRSHAELSAANDLKSNFISIASHELRTPVSYILGITKLLNDNRDPDRLTFAMQSIAARAKRIDDIIHDMFKLMPAGIHTYRLNYDDVSVPDLLEAIYLDIFPFVERRGQKLIIDVQPALPTIRVDRAKIQDVLENLLVNAIKFTDNSGVIRLSAASKTANYVAFAITDQGPGISAQAMPHIFEPFFTGLDVLKHSTGDFGYQKKGMGLGLAIVRYFVELHGGSIDVISNSAGSTFTVNIPITPVPWKTGQAPPAPADAT
jgi:signal transduction histidine kinase